MPKDKQLNGTSLTNVLRKRTLDQALNAKEFAVAAGISYSAARQWFRLPGFPLLNGVVFWTDFVRWRRTQAGPNRPGEDGPQTKALEQLPVSIPPNQLPARAAKILSEAG